MPAQLYYKPDGSFGCTLCRDNAYHPSDYWVLMMTANICEIATSLRKSIEKLANCKIHITLPDDIEERLKREQV